MAAILLQKQLFVHIGEASHSLLCFESLVMHFRYLLNCEVKSLDEDRSRVQK